MPKGLIEQAAWFVVAQSVRDRKVAQVRRAMTELRNRHALGLPCVCGAHPAKKMLGFHADLCAPLWRSVEVV